MKVLSIREFSKKGSLPKLNWREERDNGIFTALDNPQKGRVERVLVCTDDGKPVYDTYQISEGPVDSSGHRKFSSGAIVVPYYQRDGFRVGIIKRIRELVVNPETGEQGKTISIEFPRGFSSMDEMDEKTAMRELGEETGKVAKIIKKIGSVNPNTAFYITSGVSVYAAELDSGIESKLKRDSDEPILSCDFYPYEIVRSKVANQEIFCGFTLSSMMMFEAFLYNS